MPFATLVDLVNGGLKAMHLDLEVEDSNAMQREDEPGSETAYATDLEVHIS